MIPEQNFSEKRQVTIRLSIATGKNPIIVIVPSEPSTAQEGPRVQAPSPDWLAEESTLPSPPGAYYSLSHVEQPT
jgi:hypothetical protein